VAVIHVTHYAIAHHLEHVILVQATLLAYSADALFDECAHLCGDNLEFLFIHIIQ
jgi:hypothetical protein